MQPGMELQVQFAGEYEEAWLSYMGEKILARLARRRQGAASAHRRTEVYLDG